MMKIALNKSENGQALILVLILLLLAGIIIASLLGFMGTGLKSGQVFEKKMHQLYAADAGVEDAIWHLQNGEIEVLEGEEVPLPDPPILNGNTVKTVSVTIEDKTVEEDEQRTYLITSTATSQDGSSTTIIQAYVTNVTRYFAEGEEVDPYETVEGDAYFEGDAILHNQATINGNVYVDGDVSLDHEAEITGNLFATGDITLSSAGAILGGDVCSEGELILNADTAIVGNARAAGDVTLGARATIGGDVYAGGTTVELNKDAQIAGTLHVRSEEVDIIRVEEEQIGYISYNYEEQCCPLDLDLGIEILSWEIS